MSRVPYGGSRLLDHLRQFLYMRNVSLVNDVESYIIRHVRNQIYASDTSELRYIDQIRTNSNIHIRYVYEMFAKIMCVSSSCLIIYPLRTGLAKGCILMTVCVLPDLT